LALCSFGSLLFWLFAPRIDQTFLGFFRLCQALPGVALRLLASLGVAIAVSR